MNGYSEDLRRKIASAVDRGMFKAHAARTFGVSLSSIKRYTDKAGRGESLAPKKSFGSAPRLRPQARREGHKVTLAEDLQERPFASLQNRCECVQALTGLSVSRSTVCRAIARRIGSTRKKGGDPQPSATSL